MWLMFLFSNNTFDLMLMNSSACTLYSFVYMHGCICLCTQACIYRCLVDPITLCIHQTQSSVAFQRVCVSHWCAEHANIIRAQSGVKPILWGWREKSEFSTLIREAHTERERETTHTLVEDLWCAVCAPWVLIKRCTGSLENTHMHRGPPVNLQPFHGCSGPCELPTLPLHHACINIYHTSNNFLCPLRVHKSSMCRYYPLSLICPPMTT